MEWTLFVKWPHQNTFPGGSSITPNIRTKINFRIPRPSKVPSNIFMNRCDDWILFKETTLDLLKQLYGIKLRIQRDNEEWTRIVLNNPERGSFSRYFLIDDLWETLKGSNRSKHPIYIVDFSIWIYEFLKNKSPCHFSELYRTILGL